MARFAAPDPIVSTTSVVITGREDDADGPTASDTGGIRHQRATERESG